MGNTHDNTRAHWRLLGMLNDVEDKQAPPAVIPFDLAMMRGDQNVFSIPDQSDPGATGVWHSRPRRHGQFGTEIILMYGINWMLSTEIKECYPYFNHELFAYLGEEM